LYRAVPRPTIVKYKETGFLWIAVALGPQVLYRARRASAGPSSAVI
jgi:hypothetical protein